jgi:prepilin-type N-terminal cleavage/methylation domain-containing protein
MKNFLRAFAVRPRKGQAGFTLVELLVVVGIIVALAAAIVPSVVIFAGKGGEGAKASENDAVQTAMDTLMADNAVTTVVARQGALSNSTNDFSALDLSTTVAGSQYLSTYLRDNPTKYFYCWNASGKLIAQHDASQACP